MVSLKVLLTRKRKRRILEEFEKQIHEEVQEMMNEIYDHNSELLKKEELKKNLTLIVRRIYNLELTIKDLKKQKYNVV